MPQEVEEATFRHVVFKFSKLNEEEWSSPCVVHNLPWKIMVCPRVSQTGTWKKTLGFYLQCNTESKSEDWSCYARAKLRIKAQKTGIKDFAREIEHTYNSKENDLGFSQFVDWDWVLDEKNGLIKKNKVILEVALRAEKPVGVDQDSEIVTECSLNQTCGSNRNCKPRTEESSAQQNMETIDATPNHSSASSAEGKEDHFDVFGKYIALRLRSMEKTQGILAQKLINDVLFEADSGTLTRYTMIHAHNSQNAVSSTGNVNGSSRDSNVEVV